VRLTPGARLGPYEVLSVLGTGGMAEVYRARDTRLGREVALKVVNEALASDPELVRRFEQEARLAGSLNHPNLVAVHDLGLHEGAPYFITELLQGESLRHRLSRGRIPLQSALEWGAQLARGLAAAHARGIVHRDVKPDNVFISSDGQVKLLDFGIAKLAEAARDKGPHGLMDVTVTPTGGATRTGSVLGTPGYMSPEQVRGESVDARTDIFSLGAVVYEMLSGKRAFPGATVVESGYAILHDEPEPLPAEVPPVVAQVVLHCLEKELARRLQSASDLAFELEVLRSPTGSTGPVEPRREEPVARRRRWWFAAGAVALVAAAFAVASSRGRAPVTAFPVEVEQVTYRWGSIGGARFLLDGRVVFSAAFEGEPEELFSRPPGSPAAQSLALQDVRLAAVSRTGELAVLLRPRASTIFTRRGTLAKVPSVGGAPREIAEHVERADWSPTGELAAVVASGGDRILEYPPGKELFRTPGWISDPRFSFKGDRIAFLHHPVFGDDMGEVVVVDLLGSSKTLSRRWPRTLGLAWGLNDSEVWFTAGTQQRNLLVALDLGGRARELYRSPSDIRLEDVAQDGSALVSNQVERSELAYVGGEQSKQTLLTWLDWTNSLVAISADHRVLFSVSAPAPSKEGPQGSLTVLRKTDGSATQILGEGTAQDLTPDGHWALVTSTDSRTLTALPTGPGQPRKIASHGLQMAAARWLPDGKRLVVVGRGASDPDYRLYLLRGDGSPPVQLSEAPLGGRRLLHLSADGRWAAAVDPALTPLLILLTNGSTARVPGVENDATPRGWSPEGNLWITVGGDRDLARARLRRVDVRDGRVLEERIVGPVDPTGSLGVSWVVLTPDGKGLAFAYGHTLGYLYILRGVGQPAR
jgi:eukaryotic-like serine/threonine-protein kinase